MIDQRRAHGRTTAAVGAGWMGEVYLLPILLVTNWTAELEKKD